VAWEEVCRPKDASGLGIKNLKIQNQCLLLKFTDKVLSGARVPLNDWCFRGSNPDLIPSPASLVYLGHVYNSTLDLLRSHSRVHVGNDILTAFWLD
jgi:hypothetical protein